MASMRSTLGIGAMLFVAACASDTTPTAPATPAFDRSPIDNGAAQATANRHLFELRGSPNVAAAATHGGGGTGISYHGGPVLRTGTNVAAVYWASSSPIYSGGPTPGTHGSGSADGSLVGYFLSHLGGSSYFNINTTYTDGGGQSIANVVSYTQYWANNTSAPSGTQVVSDAQMIAMLQSGFNSGALTYDPSTLYAIFTAGQVNLGGGFGGQGGTSFQYCAYHTHGTVTISSVNKTVLYAAMPYDAAYPSSCTDNQAPNTDFGADAEVNTLAHETEETTTDLMGNAWFDRRGYENADKCAWNFGTTFSSGGSSANITVGTKNFMVQQNWVNAGSGGCLKQYP
jgi:Phosphate-induced protein 1 conserved region